MKFPSFVVFTGQNSSAQKLMKPVWTCVLLKIYFETCFYSSGSSKGLYTSHTSVKHTPQVIYVVHNVLVHNILNNVFQYTETFIDTVLKESQHIIWGCRLLADRHGTVEYTLLSTASLI